MQRRNIRTNVNRDKEKTERNRFEVTVSFADRNWRELIEGKSRLQSVTSQAILSNVSLFQFLEQNNFLVAYKCTGCHFYYVFEIDNSHGMFQWPQVYMR
jgi:hypothetical protein